jgi:hypothetical protein
MAHFAQLDENNVVTQVVVINNNELLDNGVEREEKGVDFCKSVFGPDTVWKQTSYNKFFRKNYAAIGYTYRSDIDAFVAPKPFASWSLDAEAQWQPPVPMPINGLAYKWNEANQSWVQVIDQVL